MVATQRLAPTRLPGGGRDPHASRSAEVAKGLVALFVTAALVVGIPVALYLGFGTPWPDEMPSSDWIYADFGPRDVMAILVAVVWLAWLHFVWCLLVEFAAERRGRGLSPRVPGGGLGTQPLARRLVGAVLLLSGGVAATLPSATAVTMAHQDQGGRIAAVAQAAQAGGTVGTADHADDKTPERSHRATAAFTDEKAGALHKYVEVQPPEGRNYDTLWGIAERYLGDGLRYKEIAGLNRGVVQPDGTTLQNPDLIYPGWILKLPSDAEGPGLRTPDHQQAPDRGTGHPDTPHHEPQVDDGSTGGDDTATVTPTGGDGSDATITDDASMMALGGFSTVGALLAAGLLFSLRRRRGWDGGPNPRGGKPLDQEFDMRGAADESSAIFVDKVLRGLGSSIRDGSNLPAPSTSVLGADGLALTFPADARVNLGAPWTGDAGGRTWLVRRTAAITVPPGRLSPLPGLVALGTGSRQVETMLDIESVAGVVSLSGDLNVARDVAVGLGVALATNRWADNPRVTFVGFADDLARLAPDSIRHYDDLPTVFEMVDAKRRRQHSACAAGGHESVRAARLADADARRWAPEFLVLSGVPTEADVARLTELSQDPRNAVGVIVVGDVKTAPVRLVASSEGRLWCGPLGIDVAAHRMSADTYRDALGIFDDEVAKGGDTDLVSAPVVDPDSLDVTCTMPVEIQTLGSLAVTGPGELDEERRDLLTELVVYLALHPEGIHPNVLSAALWPRGVTDAVRDSTLAQAATWLGNDEQGEPRLRVNDEGMWVLSRSGVRFDWDVFRALANRSGTGDDAIGDLELALTLVTGGAWTSLPAGRYGWLAYESVEADTRVAVVAVARRLASLTAAAGNPLRARNALQAGLRMAPACEEIWRDALRLASTHAGRGDVHAVADDMYAAIARFGSPRGAQSETDALIDELLPGYRRSPAA